MSHGPAVTDLFWQEPSEEKGDRAFITFPKELSWLK